MVIGHKKQCDFLKRKFEQKQLSHAYLFTGEDGIGKKFFAKEFAEFVGCKFPDLMIAEPVEDKEIPVSKIREIQNFLSYKSYNVGFKIVIVDEAHKMNVEAQNCFLKTLEEPKGQTILFLISSKPDMLLTTIFSRCQTMKFSRPRDLPQNSEKSERENKLLNDLLPVIGSNFADKFKYVKSIDFEKQNAGEIVEVLQRHLRDQLLSSLRASTRALAEEKGVTTPKQSDLIKKIKEDLELTEEISNKLLFTNANQKLALEILLMEL